MSDQQSSPASYANAAVVALGLIFGACAAEEHAAEAPSERASPTSDHGLAPVGVTGLSSKTFAAPAAAAP